VAEHAARGVAIIEQVALPQRLQLRIVQAEARGEVLVVVLRDVEQRGLPPGGCVHHVCGIRGGEGDVMHARAGQRRDEAPGAGACAFRDIQRQADTAIRRHEGAGADQAVGIR
jgi:hypothetical protein